MQGLAVHGNYDNNSLIIFPPPTASTNAPLLKGNMDNGVHRDIQAVRAAIISKWSNGRTEGQITKLKLIKRQMYGCGKLDLLQARLIGAR